MITLVLGGARSGKSEIAERMAARSPQPVTYIATAAPARDDDEWTERVRRHRARRPADWNTVEADTDVVAALRATPAGTVLLDALGPWVAAQPEFSVDAARLCAALTGRIGDTIVVSEEVGLGVHPSTEVGRHFRDALGDVNRAVASVAHDVVLVVAGRVLPLRPWPEP